MSKTAAEELLELAEKRTSGTGKIGQIRPIFDKIEYAMVCGASQEEIVEALNKHGYDVTVKFLRQSLFKIRGERGLLNQSKLSRVFAKPDSGAMVLVERSPAKPKPKPAPTEKESVPAVATAADVAPETPATSEPSAPSSPGTATTKKRERERVADRYAPQQGKTNPIFSKLKGGNK